MTRQTSIDVYHKIKEDGLLGKLQFTVYDVLFIHGPMTQGETYHNYLRSYQQHSIGPRFAELLDRGAIQIVGKRSCGVTGLECMVWDVTDKIPVKLEKPKTKDRIIKELREEIARLNTRLDSLYTVSDHGQGRLF